MDYAAIRNEPTPDLSDPHALLAGHLDYYRATLLSKLDGLDDERLRSSLLPSGWNPLGLLKHLTHVDRRWLVWGFLGDPVDEPWADHDPETGGWMVHDDESYAELRAAFEEQWRRSREIVADSALSQRARTGGRFDSDPPALAWILVHLLQEYARHVGHLDVVRELIDGSTGE